MSTSSREHKLYLKKLKQRKLLIIFVQISIIVLLLSLWQIAADKKWINTFLTSSPKEVVNTFLSLLNQNNIFNHIYKTVYETVISFLIASILGLIIASILWWNDFIAKVLDPYLTVLNSLPKVSLGPLIIIWVGANTNSIIFMALMISLIISIINIYNGFMTTDKSYITLLKSFKATKVQIYKNVIIPANIVTIVNCLKINISMSLIGVIMGELLVSKEGLGYLIMYASQVFNINLVITSIVILAIISYLMYFIVNYIEKKISK